MATSWPNQDSKVTSEATLLLVGGRDTTAATLSNLFFYLARQPETYNKLREECLSVPAEISHDQLRELRYLNDCIRESKC
jgi:cytochrome P450